VGGVKIMNLKRIDKRTFGSSFPAKLKEKKRLKKVFIAYE